MAWERSGEDTEGRGKKAREEAAWMERAIQIDIEREGGREVGPRPGRAQV